MTLSKERQMIKEMNETAKLLLERLYQIVIK